MTRFESGNIPSAPVRAVASYYRQYYDALRVCQYSLCPRTSGSFLLQAIFSPPRSPPDQWRGGRFGLCPCTHIPTPVPLWVPVSAAALFHHELSLPIVISPLPMPCWFPLLFLCVLSLRGWPDLDFLYPTGTPDWSGLCLFPSPGASPSLLPLPQTLTHTPSDAPSVVRIRGRFKSPAPPNFSFRLYRRVFVDFLTPLTCILLCVC